MSRFAANDTVQDTNPNDQGLWAGPEPATAAPERGWETPPAGRNADTGNGFAVAGLVFGIISFLILAPVFGTLGVVFSAIGKKKRQPLATAALIVSIIGLAAGVLLEIFVIGFSH